MYIPRRALTAIGCAAVSSDRNPSITGLRLETHKDHSRAVACDGSTLTVVSWARKPKDEDHPGVTLGAEVVGNAVAAKRPSVKHQDCWVDTDGYSATIRSVDGLEPVKGETISGSYPDYEYVMKMCEGPAESSVLIDPKKVIKACRMVQRTIGDASISMRINLHGTDKPVEFLAHCGEDKAQHTAVYVMPLSDPQERRKRKAKKATAK